MASALDNRDFWAGVRRGKPLHSQIIWFQFDDFDPRIQAIYLLDGHHLISKIHLEFAPDSEVRLAPMNLRFVGITAVAATSFLPAIPAAVSTDSKVPFDVGETLKYDVSWSGTFIAGQATFRVVDQQLLASGRTGYALQAEVQSGAAVSSLYKLNYKMESVLDAASPAAVWSMSTTNEGGRVGIKTITFGPADADVELRSTSTTRSKIKLPPHTLDILGALYVLRALPIKSGGSVTMPVLEGDALSQIQLTFGPKEIINTGLGKLAAWKVTPVMLDEKGHHRSDRNLAIWISDDLSHKPLRFDASLPVGNVTLTLAK